MGLWDEFKQNVSDAADAAAEKWNEVSSDPAGALAAAEASVEQTVSAVVDEVKQDWQQAEKTVENAVSTAEQEASDVVQTATAAVSATVDEVTQAAANGWEQTGAAVTAAAANAKENYNETVQEINTAYQKANKSEIGIGFLQASGGITEGVLGFGIATGGSLASGFTASPVAVAAGGYVMLDGVSNFSGGLSRMYNGLHGLNSEQGGDSENFMKTGYIAAGQSLGISDDKWYSGKNVYDATQLGIGIFSISKGVSELPQNYEKFNSWLGQESVEHGAQTWKSVSASLGKIDIESWTQGGLLVDRLTLKPLHLTGGAALTSVDIFNGNETVKSINGVAQRVLHGEAAPAAQPSPMSVLDAAIADWAAANRQIEAQLDAGRAPQQQGVSVSR